MKIKMPFKRKKKPTIPIIGVTTFCKGNRHVIFLDYDSLNLEDVCEDVAYLQDKYKLYHGFIIESSKNKYHTIFLDKVSYQEYVKIVADSCCDPEFYKSKLKTIANKRNGVLRISSKEKSPPPKLAKIIISTKGPYYILSKAHYMLLQKLNPKTMVELDRNLLDNTDEVELLKYLTFKKDK